MEQPRRSAVEPARPVTAVLLALYGGGLCVWLALGLVPALVDGVGPLHDAVGRGAAAGRGWWSDFLGRVDDASGHAAPPARVTLEYLFSALNVALGIVLIRYRRRDRTAQLLVLGMIGTAATFNDQSHSVFRYDLLGAAPPVEALHLAFHTISGVAYMYAVVTFPDGRLVPRLTGARQWVVRAAYLVLTLAVAFVSLGGSFEPHPPFLVAFFGFLIPAVGVAAQAYRCRTAATDAQRQQSRLLAFALLPALAGGLAFVLVNVGAGSVGSSADLEQIVLRVFPALFALVPVALFVGIVRHRLWDIDVVVGRALVYGALAAFIAAAYVVIVVGIGAAVGGGGGSDDVLALAATAVVAVAFEPLRERLSRVANRLVYGERASPYEVLSRFAAGAAESGAGDDVLPRMARVVAEGTDAAWAQVWLRVDDDLVTAAAWPAGAGPEPGAFPAVAHDRPPAVPGADLVVTVRHAGEVLGALAVAKRPGEEVTGAEATLLADLASQAGLVLHNARLAAQLAARVEEISERAEELRASRRRIIAAQDAERRRLERDIHDGAQQELVAVAVAVRLARTVAATEPARAAEMCTEVQVATADALERLRHLARGVYPATLAEQGLAEALRAHTARLPFPVDVAADADWQGTPEVEAAIYFTCLEALQNALKHARPANVTISLGARDGELRFSVVDDGAGFDPAETGGGAGLANMADRLAALGGCVEVTSRPGAGTTVAGRAPAGVPA